MDHKATGWVAAMFAFFLVISLSGFGDKPRVLEWEDLVPKQNILENPLGELGLQLRLDLEYIAVARYHYKMGQISEVNADYEYALELEHKLKTKKVDVESMIVKFDAFLDEIERRNKSVVKDLDSKLVRIPGYALPLETSTTAIEEFLLVPTVGACIHTPVPPANQMVFVKVKEPYEAKELYDPVWVTGFIKLEHDKNSITYSDGEGAVESAYTIQNAIVEAYDD